MQFIQLDFQQLIDLTCLDKTSAKVDTCPWIQTSSNDMMVGFSQCSPNKFRKEAEASDIATKNE